MKGNMLKNHKISIWNSSSIAFFFVFGSSFREKERGRGIHKIIFTSFFFLFKAAFKLSGSVVTTKQEPHKIVL